MAVIKFGGTDEDENEFLTTDAHAVAVYELERHYGGSEEGGWWYTTRELIAVATADNEATADALRDELGSGEYKNTGRSLSSVNFGRSGDDRAYALWQFKPGEEIKYDASDSSRYS